MTYENPIWDITLEYFRQVAQFHRKEWESKAQRKRTDTNISPPGRWFAAVFLEKLVDQAERDFQIRNDELQKALSIIASDGLPGGALKPTERQRVAMRPDARATTTEAGKAALKAPAPKPKKSQQDLRKQIAERREQLAEPSRRETAHHGWLWIEDLKVFIRRPRRMVSEYDLGVPGPDGGVLQISSEGIDRGKLEKLYDKAVEREKSNPTVAEQELSGTRLNEQEKALEVAFGIPNEDREEDK